MFGLPAYGRGFTASGGTYAPGGSASGAGITGPYTGEAGYMAYYEICQKLSEGWTAVQDNDMKSMYAYSPAANQWIGYEDVNTLALRCDFINAEGLGGAMFWDLSLDDMHGEFCGQGPYPLVNLFNTCLN